MYVLVCHMYVCYLMQRMLFFLLLFCFFVAVLLVSIVCTFLEGIRYTSYTHQSYHPCCRSFTCHVPSLPQHFDVHAVPPPPLMQLTHFLPHPLHCDRHPFPPPYLTHVSHALHWTGGPGDGPGPGNGPCPEHLVGTKIPSTKVLPEGKLELPPYPMSPPFQKLPDAPSATAISPAVGLAVPGVPALTTTIDPAGALYGLSPFVFLKPRRAALPFLFK